MKKYRIFCMNISTLPCICIFLSNKFHFYIIVRHSINLEFHVAKKLSIAPIYFQSNLQFQGDTSAPLRDNYQLTILVSIDKLQVTKFSFISLLYIVLRYNNDIRMIYDLSK